MLHVPSPRKFLKALIVFTTIVLLFAISGTILLWAVYHLPAWKMENNMRLSAETLHSEGIWPDLYPNCTSKLDNFTDALMLSAASYRSEERNIIQAMRVPLPYTEPSDNPYQAVVSHYIDGANHSGAWGYSRYWHGYLTILKPLLLLMDYTSIRFLNAIAQTVLLCLVIYLMEKRGLKQYIPAYLVSIAFWTPIVMVRSLQFAACYYITILTSVALLVSDGRKSMPIPIIFLVSGILTAYFDLLTYPLAAFGIPAVLFICLRPNISMRPLVKEGIGLCFSWGFGYAGMWASKWLIGSLILGESVFSSAAQAITYRTSTDAAQIGLLINNMMTAIRENIGLFFKTPISLIALGMVCFLFVSAFHHSRRGHQKKPSSSLWLPFILLACAPLLWYLVLSNHSVEHAWFTHKALAISIFAILCALTRLRIFYKESSAKP